MKCRSDTDRLTYYIIPSSALTCALGLTERRGEIRSAHGKLCGRNRRTELHSHYYLIHARFSEMSKIFVFDWAIGNLLVNIYWWRNTLQIFSDEYSTQSKIFKNIVQDRIFLLNLGTATTLTLFRCIIQRWIICETLVHCSHLSRHSSKHGTYIRMRTHIISIIYYIIINTYYHI